MSFLSNRQWLVVAMTTLCMSSVIGTQNLSDQLVIKYYYEYMLLFLPQNILGEFNAFEQEQLVGTS